MWFCLLGNNFGNIYLKAIDFYADISSDQLGLVYVTLFPSKGGAEFVSFALCALILLIFE